MGAGYRTQPLTLDCKSDARLPSIPSRLHRLSDSELSLSLEVDSHAQENIKCIPREEFKKKLTRSGYVHFKNSKTVTCEGSGLPRFESQLCC